MIDASLTLTRHERRMAAYAASMIHEPAADSAELAARLVDLGDPPEVLESIRSSAGRWPVSDDDRLAVIIDYAARLARHPAQIAEPDIQRLRGLDLSELDILELNCVVTACVDRPTSGRSARRSPGE